jgi:hypothetical protein
MIFGKDKWRDQTGALVAKAGSDETRMQAICSDTRAVQASSKLTRKEDVASTDHRLS